MTARDGGWSLLYSRPAQKDIARLDPPVRRRVLLALGELTTDPIHARGLRKLSQRSELRLRVGDWRVILDLDANEHEILVHSVLPRGRAYDR